jgi:cytochrome c oxidase subunit 3
MSGLSLVTTLPPRPDVKPGGIRSGSDDDGFRGNGGSGGSGGGGPSERTYKLGMWVALVAILMFFVAFSSAYIVRQGFSDDWRPIPLPSILWLTTAMLVGSSVTLELARRSLKNGLEGASNRWLTLTTVLGLLFLLGQYLAWRQLSNAGIYISTNPHSSFFYMLTGAHGLHLMGGLIALLYLTLRAWRAPGYPVMEFVDEHRRSRSRTFRKELAVDLTAVYWHFMDVLWVYLFILLFVWR